MEKPVSAANKNTPVWLGKGNEKHLVAWVVSLMITGLLILGVFVWQALPL